MKNIRKVSLGIFILAIAVLCLSYSPTKIPQQLNLIIPEAQKDLPGWNASFTGRILKWFPFNNSGALKEWQEKVFKDRVLYSVKLETKDGYLSAFSKRASSGIFYRIGFSAKKFPMVSWKWKVLKFPDKSEEKDVPGTWIEKDDYAARFYVIFPSLFFSRTKSLEYVWDKDLPEGTVMTSPYFKNIKIFVIESGEENSGKWVFEERNVYEDYLKAFKSEPGSAGAIAIMTDTDNTLSSAEANYDEVRVGYKNE